MAPAYAMPRMLDRAGLTLQDFDFYEIHEAFAAQVLCTLKAWEDPAFCKERLGLRRAARRDRPRQAQRQRRLAGRRSPVRRDRRADRRRPRQAARTRTARAAALISICAAGGQGVVAILEAPEAPMSDRYSQTRQRARRRRPSPSSSGCRSRSQLDRYERAGAARCCRRAGGRSARRRGGRLGAAARHGAARATPGSTRSAERGRRRGPGSRRSSSTPPGSPTRPSWSSCSASSTRRSARLRRCGRVVVLGTPPADAGAPAPRRPRSARWRASPARSARRSAARRDRPARLRRAGRRGPARLDAALPALAASAYVSGQVVRVGAGVAAAPPRSTGSARSPARSALVTGASRGIGAAIAAVLAPRRRHGRRRSTSRRPPSDLHGVDRARSAATRSTLDITAEDAPRADRRSTSRRARRRRHRRPQRRHHPRQARSANMPDDALGRGDRRQPRRARSGSPTRCSTQRPSAPTAASSASPRSRGIAGNVGPDQLRRLQGRRDRAGRRAGAASWPSAASRSTRSRPASSRPR